MFRTFTLIICTFECQKKSYFLMCTSKVIQEVQKNYPFLYFSLLFWLSHRFSTHQQWTTNPAYAQRHAHQSSVVPPKNRTRYSLGTSLEGACHWSPSNLFYFPLFLLLEIGLVVAFSNRLLNILFNILYNNYKGYRALKFFKI